MADNIVKHEDMLNQARVLLREVEKHSLEALMMVDCIQRLGMDYLFEEEIQVILDAHHLICTSNGDDYVKDDLHEVALRFRLLRQNGYYVPFDVFNHFMDENGGLDKKLRNDVRGLTSLSEASELGLEDENALAKAGELSRKLLNAQKIHLDYHEAQLARNAMENPFYKSLAAFTAKDYIDNIIGCSTWESIFKELAIMESNLVRMIHRKEILEVSKWWKDLGLAKELKFARDQPLKWYMWTLTTLTDPCLSEERVELTKPISLIYIIDDIFDVYGTLDELILFTEAVNRWDIDCTDTRKLPDYIKICFRALDEITNQFSFKVYTRNHWNPVNTLRKAWATLFNAFLVEAKWFASKQSPSSDEYLKNATISSGVHVVLVHIYFLLATKINKQCVDALENTAEIPGLISPAATILRLWDDLGSALDENQEGHDGSYIEYYMKERKGILVEEAREHVKDLISQQWKKLAKECLFPHPFSKSFADASLNAARMVAVMYNYDDSHCLPRLKEHMKSLLFG